MLKNISRFTLLVFGLSFMVMFCPVSASEIPSSPTLDGNWIVESFRTNTGNITAPISNSSISALFSDGNLSGISGCNLYQSNYTAASGGIIINQPVTTLKICQPEIMNQEMSYLQDLTDAALMQVNKSRLVLMDDDEEVLITYVPDISDERNS